MNINVRLSGRSAVPRPEWRGQEQSHRLRSGTKSGLRDVSGSSGDLGTRSLTRTKGSAGTVIAVKVLLL